MNYAAVVFMKLDPKTGQLTPSSEKPYFYLDPFNISAGGYALTHNGSDFGLVQIIRQLTKEEAILKVTKPFLAFVSFSESQYRCALEHAAALTSDAAMHRINKAIDAELAKANKPPKPLDEDEDDY